MVDTAGALSAATLGMAAGIVAGFAIGWAVRWRRRRADAAARSAIDRIVVRRLSLALDAADAGAWEWRLGLPSLRASGFARLLGAEDDEHVTVDTWASAVHPLDRPVFWSTFDAAIADGAPWACLHRIELPDGSTRWLDARGEPIREGGAVVGMLGVCVDATERQLRQQRTREAARVAHAVSGTAATLTALSDEDLIVAEACESAAAIFDCDEVAYWTVSTDGSVALAARHPGTWEPMRSTVGELTARATAVDPASGAMLLATPAPGMRSTRSLVAAVTIANETEAYLVLGWDQGSSGEHGLPAEPASMPDAAWLGALDRYCANIAIALVVARRQQASHDRDRLARRLQAGLMPSIEQLTGSLSLQTVYQAGEERLMLGGDFLDISRHDDGGVSFVLGDVCGHGPSEAALGTILRSAWIGVSADGVRDPARWASVLHGVLLARREQESTFVTLVTGTIDAAGTLLKVAVAGHPPPLLIVDGTVTSLDTGAGPALGIASSLSTEQARVALPPRFALLVVTDGLFEGFAAAGARLGYDGLVGLVERFSFHEEHALRRFVSTVEALHGGRLSDDAAAIVLSRG